LPVGQQIRRYVVPGARAGQGARAGNAKLKRMYAELALENTLIEDVLSRKLQRRRRRDR
jgi:hypothetical protein